MNHEESGVFFLPMMYSHCQLTDFEWFMSSLDVNFVASGPTHESVLCFYIRQTLPGCVHECKYQCREVFVSLYRTPLSVPSSFQIYPSCFHNHTLIRFL